MIKLYDLDHVKFGVEDLDANVHSWEAEFGLHERTRDDRMSFLALNY